MNATQTGRTQAALKAMIEGKLLFQVTKDRETITDGYIFQVPSSQEDYCVMTITSPENEQRVTKIECQFPHPSWLLRELGAIGKYQGYGEASIDCPDARRVLAMFQGWVTINALRHGSHQLPEPDLNAAGSSDLSVQYI
jgi:Ni,Fe-hydrogenase III component G